MKIRNMKVVVGSTSLKKVSKQNKTRFRPTAPAYQGARPNICGRPPESHEMPSLSPCYMPFLSLFARVFSPVSLTIVFYI